jgi:type VI secretion system secreted protein VgrG
MPFDASYRRLSINTPLGENILVITNLDGVDELSKPFSYKLRMLSEDDAIPAEKLIGQNVSIVMLDPDDHPTHLNAYMRTFVNHGRGDRATVYTAEIVSWLWFLSRRTDCRIFQEMSVPQIVEDVFKHAHTPDFELSGLKGTYAKREYCVQYRETDFSFVSRLLEEEGIFYYFRHEPGKHVLVLGDDPAAYTECKDNKARYATGPSFAEVDDNITSWEHRYEFRSGRVALADFNFMTPEKPILSKERTTLKVPPASNCELYDYPGNFPDRGVGDQRVRRMMEAEEVDFDRVVGSSVCRSYGAGRKFTVDAHHLDSEKGRTYVATKVHHRVDVGSFVSGGDKPEGYSNNFEAIPATVPFRPARIAVKGVVRGPQTAIVVGPSGEEIYADEHGRVKVKFHWDRTPNVDEKSSCWIRVAQSWASKKWGALFTPRIGDEVIIDFIEGDPDRPIITGRVYNAINAPPYDPKSLKQISGVKSNTSKGGGGFNEIRFDDTKGQEQIFVHGEKNHDTRIKNDCFEWIGHDRHLIVKNNQTDHIEMDRQTKMDRDDVTEVGRDRHLKIAGKEAKGVDGSHSFTVKGDVIEVFKANQSTEITQNLYVKAMNVVIEALTGLTIKCGGSSVVVDPSGVTVTGPMVTIDGGLTKINSGPGSPAGTGTSGSLVPALASAAAMEADKADPGEVAAVKAREMETKTGKYGSTPPPQFKPKPPGDPDKPKSWIEIELLDEENEPVPGEKYRVTLPDGTTVAEGTLDNNGQARVSGIDPGNCKITFPNLDHSAWKRKA